jgi:hypothetical protein
MVPTAWFRDGFMYDGRLIHFWVNNLGYDKNNGKVTDD